jgi:hypothetical protein
MHIHGYPNTHIQRGKSINETMSLIGLLKKQNEKNNVYKTLPSDQLYDTYDIT